jgi:hypothetical protein
MKKLEKNIVKCYKDLEVKENEEKLIISIVAKINNSTLKTETSLYIDGNKIQIVKILTELLRDNKAIELIDILEMIKDNI